ncbi:MAG TPA: chemotaxis protein CheW [Verrucomicrobiae bacterium]|nr:chemotaxis protein CheW [Verrucomicrobiae bacterium]
MSQAEPPVSASLPGRPQPEQALEATGCWSQIGVYGDGSCPELRKFVHCRNCPVYSAAGVQLIDRPLPPNYRREWAQHFAEERRITEAGSVSVILFRIRHRWLALPTHSFQEVAEKRPIHSLPARRTPILLGLANVRGELIMCISVSHLLQLDPVPAPEELRQNYHRLLVLQWETSRLAFPVDEVHGPQRFHPQELQNPPVALTSPAVRFEQALIKWQERTAALLDPRSVFSTLHQSLP